GRASFQYGSNDLRAKSFGTIASQRTRLRRKYEERPYWFYQARYQCGRDAYDGKWHGATNLRADNGTVEINARLKALNLEDWRIRRHCARPVRTRAHIMPKAHT